MAEPNLASAQFGGFWVRLLALLADSAIVCLVAVLILGGAATALGKESLDLAILVAWLFSFLYWPVMQASGLQATFGKALLGLRVTGYQGTRISILRSFGRELAKMLSSMVLMIGFVMAAFTGRKQALHDLIASTYVVQEGRRSVVAALATAVVGFALPVVLLPMMAGGAVMSMMTEMASAGVPQQPAPPPVVVRKAVVQAPAPKAEPAKPAAAPPPAPVAVAQVNPAPSAPVVTAKPAAPPEPIKVAALPELLPSVSEPKPAAAPKPAPKAAKPKAAAPRVANFEPKAMAGPKFNDLMTAVLYKDVEGATELLKLGKWPDKPDSRGTTPLMTAVELGDAAMVEALLRGGANASRALPVAEEARDPGMLMLLKRYGAR